MRYSDSDSDSEKVAVDGNMDSEDWIEDGGVKDDAPLLVNGSGREKGPARRFVTRKTKLLVVGVGLLLGCVVIRFGGQYGGACWDRLAGCVDWRQGQDLADETGMYFPLLFHCAHGQCCG
jgi:hypothetical protein